jgi:hypothetical protein
MAPRFPLIARDRSNDSDGVTRAVATFILSGLAAMIVLGLVGAWVLRGIGTREAIRDARELTRITGVGIVEPALEHGVLTGDQAAIDRLDAIVENRVLHSNNRIVRVKLWTPDGRIVYSDEERLIGQKFPPRTAELAEAREKGVVAEVSELTEPENATTAATGSCSRSTCRSRPRTGARSSSRRTGATTSSPAAARASGARSRRRSSPP